MKKIQVCVNDKGRYFLRLYVNTHMRDLRRK